MTLPAETPEGTRSSVAVMTMLLVSQDPERLVEVQHALKPAGVRVVGCMGPAHAMCYLDEHRSCPLARHADITVVDAPASGSFTYHWKEIPAGLYGELLVRHHPARFIVMADGVPGLAGPAGAIAHVRDLQAAVDLVRSMATHPSRQPTRVLTFARKEAP